MQDIRRTKPDNWPDTGYQKGRISGAALDFFLVLREYQRDSGDDQGEEGAPRDHEVRQGHDSAGGAICP